MFVTFLVCLFEWPPGFTVFKKLLLSLCRSGHLFRFFFIDYIILSRVKNFEKVMHTVCYFDQTLYQYSKKEKSNLQNT